MTLNRDAAKDLLARGLVALLFVLLSANLLADFIRTQHITGLMLMFSEALVVILTLFRRRALVVDRSRLASAVTVLSVVGPILLRTGAADPLLPDVLTALVSLSGIAIVIA